MWKPRYQEFYLKANQFKKQYEQGVLIDKIASDSGYSLSSIYRFLKVAGVEMKPRSRNDKGRYLPKTEPNLPIDKD